MKTYAKIEIVGFVGKDPASTLQNYPNFVTFPLAFSSLKKDKNTNEDIQTTTWFECQTWNDEEIANCVRDKITKGMLISLSGALRNETYTKKDGTAGTSFKIILDKIPEIPAFDSQESKEEVKSAPVKHHRDLDDDEIPF